MKFYIVDAFADELFGGNGAGVVILQPQEPFPAEMIMLKTAAELNFSETVFLQQQDRRTFKLRYFTPAAEIDLCGHATIGAFGALRDAGMVEDGQSYYIETMAGRLEVDVEAEAILMEMGIPQTIGEISDEAELAKLAKIMGIDRKEIVFSPGIISTGLPDIILQVENKAALWRIFPDFPALTELSRQYQVTGVHAFALPHPDDARRMPTVTAYCRNFAPLYEIDEEAATGTANGALTYYLYQRGLIQPDQENVFIQGEIMRRPSRITSRLVNNSAGATNIKVGGNCKVLVRGEMLLENR